MIKRNYCEKLCKSICLCVKVAGDAPELSIPSQKPSTSRLKLLATCYHGNQTTGLLL